MTTSAASSIAATSATGNGNITDTEGENPETRGFVYGTDTSYGATTTDSGSYSAGAFTGSITGLTCNTTYHFAAYATNSGGTGYGSDTTFTTSACSAPPPAPPAPSGGGGWSGGCSTYPADELPSWGVVPCKPTNPIQGPAVSPGTQHSPPSISFQGSNTQTSGGIALPKNRQIWDVGEDILRLQQWLNTHGFTIATTGTGSPGNETDIFGPHTYRALIKFQAANNLPATGYLGPLTRAALANMAATSTSQ